MSDWIEDMIARGLLTPQQAAEARRQEAAGVTPPSLQPPTPVLPLSAPGGFVSCVPCGEIFTVPGSDATPPRACPKCGGPLRPVRMGGALIPSTAPPAEPLAGIPFGRYLLRRELGRGGMGVVFEALDRELGRTVALKMLVAPGQELDRTSAERLLREARSAARLKHPGIVTIHDAGVTEGRHYFTMDLIEGLGLDELLRPGQEPPLRDRVDLVAQVAEALGCAHAHGIVHRDVKPANVLVDRGGRAHLTDFGLARDEETTADESLTATGALLGTPHFMSPEQASRTGRHAGPASDVFSAGVLLYRALTGQLPFPGRGLDCLMAIVGAEPAAPSKLDPELPRDLETVCLKCLEKDPARRYADGTLLAADLRRWLAGGRVEARPLAWTERVLRRFTRPQAPQGAEEELRRAEAEASAAATQVRRQAEALGLLEQARIALDGAGRLLYDTEAPPAEVARLAGAARDLIDRGLAAAPGLAVAHFLRGRASELLGEDEGAEAGFREALRLDPDLAPAHFHLGRRLVDRAYLSALAASVDRPNLGPDALKLAAQAEGEFDAALAGGAGFDDGLQRRIAAGMAAYVRDDREAVGRICEQGLREFSRAQGREDLVFIRASLAPIPDRAAAMDEAIRIRPKFPAALFVRGTCRAIAGDAAGARADLDLALALRPRFVPAFVNRAMLRMGAGDLAGALEDNTAALALEPSPVAHNNRGIVRKRLGDRAGARADFDEALRLNPSFVQASVNRAILDIPEGRAAQALPGLDEAVRRLPRAPEAWLNRGWARAALGRHEEACADFEEALRLRPDFAPALFRRGVSRAAKGDAKAGLADLDRALEIDPSDAEAWLGRARVRRAAGDAAGAREDARRALDHADGESWIRAAASEILERAID
ncbi:MAG: protein kinase [Planctomycetes bacterium]|nr:protein kinase [Planctomycetota bacterium]